MFRIYLRTLSFSFSFLMSFLGCLFTHFRPRIFVVVVVVFNYIKYTFNSTRTGRNLKKGNHSLDENQVV